MKTKEPNPTTPGSPTPCKQALNQGWQPLKQIDLDQKQFDLELIIFAEHFLPHRTYSGGEYMEIGFKFGFHNRELISAYTYVTFIIFVF